MNDSDAMRAELASVLTDPTFARSPVLARLLGYLVETTIKGEGKSLKSHSVAVDGLGRSADFDAQVDTYARVQVARLRKALDGFYATSGADRPYRLQIESGSYEVNLLPLGAARRGASSGVRWWLEPRFGRPSRKAFFLFLVALLLALGGAWKWHSNTEIERWRTPNFPWVDVVIKRDGDDQSRQAVSDVRQSMMITLSRYEGVRVRFRPGQKANYRIHLELEVVDGQLREEAFVVYTEMNRIVWSDSQNFGSDPAKWNKLVEAYHDVLAFRLAHPSGAIHAFERHWNRDAGTPYGCWLRFAGQLQESRDFGDKELKTCARKWRKAAPGHSVAVALEGWVLLDESMQTITEAGRQAKIWEAVELLEANKTLNPGSTMSHIALMRAYNYAHNYRAALKTGNEAIAINPTNLDVRGMVGTTMVLNGDPQGEAMVQDAIARHFNPPPWYFAGAFTAAMMREDTVAARAALRRVSTFNHSLPLLAMLSAALEARTGNVGKARWHWAKAREAHPLLRVQPQKLFDRLPIAPAVRKKLVTWLQPVL